MSDTTKKATSRSARDRERDLFMEALELPSAAAREQFLAQACGADTALRTAVETLLRNHLEDTFLERPATHTLLLDSGEGPGIRRPLPRVEEPGDRIGPYKLLEKIGEGGCGAVYMAEQEEPVHRRVALKVIKLGMDTRSVIARFEVERRALAMMDHPNIARVLDAGTTDTGRPFFVMEMVRGIRITDFCDENELDTEARLKLFIQVCQAIQHAHQKGIIHRDIKPSNILVTLHDGVPVPKVIDFGIAKAIEQRLTDKTLFTGFQAFIGTPAYTSPEQAEMSGLDVDTRSDIYSLGVLLYELLTGETPFDAHHLSTIGLDEMRRIIREEEPQRPSTRLSTMGLAVGSGTTRSHRAPLPTLAREIQGDLDWIVMRCLEKDRTRRYATANDLSADVLRYLQDETILARPPSMVYQLQKFALRHRVMVTATASIVMILALATFFSSRQALRATRAERDQSRLRAEAEAAQRSEARQLAIAEAERTAALREAYDSDMNLAHQALAAHNYGRVVDLLNRHRPKPGGPDFRQWEWRYYWQQVRSEAASALPRQSSPIASVAISPNARLLLTSDRQGAVKLWDVPGKREIAVIRQRGRGPVAGIFSADGERLAAVVEADPRRTMVRVLAMADRQVVSEFRVEGGVEALTFTPGGGQLLMLGGDSGVREWDLATAKLTTRFSGNPPERRGPSGWRRGGVFSVDAKWIAVITEQGRIRVLDAVTGAERTAFDSFADGFGSLAFSPDGQQIAVSPSFLSGAATAIKHYSAVTGQDLGQFEGHFSWVPGIVFTADGSRLISAGADQTLRIWEVAGRRELNALHGHLSEVSCVAVTPDGKTLASGCKDGTLFLWNTERHEPANPFTILPGRVIDFDFFPEGRQLLTVSHEGAVSLWDASTLQEREKLTLPGGPVNSVRVSRDGSRVFIGMRGGEIQVLDWVTRLAVTNLARSGGGGGFGGGRGGGGGKPPPAALGLLYSTNTLASLDLFTGVRIWDTQTLRLQATLGDFDRSPFAFRATALSPDGRFLFTPGRSENIEVRELPGEAVTASLPLPAQGVTAMAASPDSSLLVVASSDGTVIFYDLKTRQATEAMRGHLLGARGFGFSADGSRLASSSHGREAVKLWDVRTRHEVATLPGEGGLFEVVRFSPDGQSLAALNIRGELHVWRAPSFQEIAKAEAAEGK